MSSRLQQRVLVLNRVWQPVNIVGVRRAVSLLFQGGAQAIFDATDATGNPVATEADETPDSAPSDTIAAASDTFFANSTSAASILADSDGGYRILDVAGWFEFSMKHPDPDPTRMLRSVRFALRLPHVILLTGFDRLPRREVRFCRRNVYLRDAFRCQYCGRVFDERELSLDHVIPRDRGGRTSWENIVTACSRCNARKSDRLPAQAGMVLRKAPARPKWRSFLSVLAGREEARPWLPFIR